MECHLVNCTHNSWKPSQYFPAWSIYSERPIPQCHSQSLSLVPLRLTVSLTPRLPPALSSNHLNQTVGLTSCPSGALCSPFPVCVISHVSKHIVVTSRQAGLRNNLGEEKVASGGETLVEVRGLTRKKDEGNNVEQK